MALETTLLVFLLLGELSGTFSQTHCKPPVGESHPQTFQRQHHDGPKTKHGNDYCGAMMHKKCMTNQDPPKTKCKETNTFIHAPKKTITSVCSNGGKPYQGSANLRVSNAPFSVTTCKIKGNSVTHLCEYKAKSYTRKIVIGCENGFPTHYDEGIIVPK
ncbi:ribonuclease-like [Ambystoma mexicanum]|uniref:ribonuclease-like n=1 Tax=Ambystoma mexicanum TaxID=8296 RepID=UPI0037E76B50